MRSVENEEWNVNKLFTSPEARVEFSGEKIGSVDYAECGVWSAEYGECGVWNMRSGMLTNL